MRQSIAMFAGVVLLLATVPARGAVQRTFVSHSGLDTNPCSVDSPCRSFAAAIVQTNPNGEVVAVDSAGYGPVTITQSVTIVAPLGVHAGVSVLSGDGVTISAGPSDVVVLRNLYINAQGGVNGITLTQALALHIEHCVVSGFSLDDIHLVPTSAAAVAISDTVARQASFSGIYADSASALTVSIDHCRLELNASSGVVVDRATLVISNTNADRNSVVGFWARGNGGTADMTVQACVVSNNGTAGIQVNAGSASVHDTTAFKNVSWNYVAHTGKLSADNCVAEGGPTGFLVQSSADVSISNCTVADTTTGVDVVLSGTARLTRNTITRNVTGISNSGGTITSTGDNMVDGNTTNSSGTISPANKM